MEPSATVTVTVAQGPGSPTDWVALAPAGSGLDDFALGWAYLNGLHAPPLTGLTSAALTFVAPSTNGNYEARWFASNGSVLIIPAVAFKVGKPKPPDPPDPPAGTLASAKVSTLCAMAAASAVLTCPAMFGPEDVGAVVAVYGAGPELNGYRQPLSSVVASVQDAQTATLAHPAVVSISPSPRAVWGIDRTATFQAMIDAAADALGGVVRLPAGHHMVRRLEMPCSIAGINWYMPCLKAYNNIRLEGAGIGLSILENWDIATPGAILELGYGAEIPGTGNDRLRNVTITGITFRQVLNPTSTAAKVVASTATEDILVTGNEFIGPSYECLYMGGGVKSWRWIVRNNIATTACGWGGPNYTNTTAALNLQGSDWIAEGNVIRNAGQGFEAGSRPSLIRGNTIGPGVPYCISFTSTGSGVWEAVAQGNVLRGCHAGGISGGNSIGTANRIRVLDNLLIDAGIFIDSGLDSNSVHEGPPDTVIHGQSVIAGNTFVLTGATLGGNGLVRIGGENSWSGRERVLVENNRVLNDGGLHEPVVVVINQTAAVQVSHLTVFGTRAAHNPQQRDVDLWNTVRSVVKLYGVRMSYDWHIRDILGGINTTVLADTLWND